MQYLGVRRLAGAFPVWTIIERQSGLKPPHSKVWYDAATDHSATSERTSMDDVIDVYKRDVDMRLIRENLKLTPDQRLRRMIEFMQYVEEFRAGRQPLKRKWARLLRANQPGDERPKKLSNWRKYLMAKR